MTTETRSKERSWLAALFFRSSIAARLTAAFAAMSAFTLGTLWVLVSYNLSNLLVKQTDAFGSTIAKQVADAATEMVLADDLLSLNVIVTKVAQSPSVESAVIFDRQNKVLAKAGTSDDPGKFAATPEVPDFGTYRAPIVFQDVTAGYTDITINKNVIAGTIKQALFIMTAAAAGLMVVSLLIALRLSKQLSAPVKKLIEAADAIREGNFAFRIEESSPDELGVLIDSFNHMADGL
ncbi:MAG TPA: HAMP domain-containing protein, partial [Pseudomonadales bacterium]|nr:HAMP domain-containing protein [Pseudomonadales bacterium]